MTMVAALILAASQGGEQSPICTDRPTKANAVCTVPAGRVQLETSVLSWSLTRLAGAETELTSVGATTAKIGLTSRSDLQVGVSPYLRQSAKQGGSTALLSGFGDVVVRYKHRLTAQSAPVQAAVIPFVKLPSAAAGLGNDRVEGGLAIPISFALGGATMSFGPEADLLVDADGRGRHLAIINLVNVAAPIAPRLTLVGELWTNLNFDPAGTVTQASADAAIAFSLSQDMQLDAGANLGLTRHSPDVELYAGVSLRL